jgi:hypothetical protein
LERPTEGAVMSKVNKYGLTPAETLAALWNAARVPGRAFFRAAEGPDVMTVEDAERLVADRTHNRRAYFDYLYGRVIKVWVTEEDPDLVLYDRDNGFGAAERALTGAKGGGV